MKLISLNVWGGKLYDPLMEFLRQQNDTTDIFCFQEVSESAASSTSPEGFRSTILDEIRSTLNEHYCYFAPIMNNATGNPPGIYRPLSIGLAMFIRRSVTYGGYGEKFVYGNRNQYVPPDLTTIPRLIQYCTIEADGVPCTIVNFHGIHGDGKMDTENRLAQSINIQNFPHGQ